MTRGDDDELRAEAHRARHGHGGTNTKRRAAYEHEATTPRSSGLPPTANGLPRSEVAQFFNGAEEGIKINVDDFTWHKRFNRRVRGERRVFYFFLGKLCALGG